MELIVNNKKFFAGGNKVKALVECYSAGLSSIESYKCTSIFDVLKTTDGYLGRYPNGYVDWKIYKDQFLKEVISKVEGITGGTVIKLVF